jgi:hypothetical protein
MRRCAFGLLACMVSFLIYTCSFFLPVFSEAYESRFRPIGYDVFMDLWFAPMYGFLVLPAQIPNIAFLFGLICAFARRWWATLGLASFAFHFGIVIARASEIHDVSDLGLGYFTWQISFLSLATNAALILTFGKAKRDAG